MTSTSLSWRQLFSGAKIYLNQNLLLLAPLVNTWLHLEMWAHWLQKWNPGLVEFPNLSWFTPKKRENLYQKSPCLELDTGLYIHLFLFIQLTPTVSSIFIAFNATDRNN